MSSEARVTVSLSVRKGNLDYRSAPTSFTADVSTARGPAPGAVEATGAGVNVAFTGLTNPGLVLLQNLDDTNPVEWGAYDGATFHPVGKLLPGELAVFRFSDSLSVGTGSANTFRLVALSGTAFVRVDAFEA